MYLLVLKGFKSIHSDKNVLKFLSCTPENTVTCHGELEQSLMNKDNAYHKVLVEV